MPINYPEVAGEVRNQLKEFFAPHMAAFAHMANETFHWAFDNMQTQTMPEIMPWGSDKNGDFLSGLPGFKK